MSHPSLLLVTVLFFIHAFTCDTAIHLPLHRRGGRFTHHQPTNLTELRQHLRQVESRYARTHLAIKHNHLERHWNAEQKEETIFEETGGNGRWYTTIGVGEPPQDLEVDLDLLSPDFYTVLTTSDGGSKYNTFGSQAHVSSDTYVHPLCRQPSDNFWLAGRSDPVRLNWPICQPSKSSRQTLAKSGTILGLAPNLQAQSISLSRIDAPSFVQQLVQKGIISLPTWSITLLDGTTGVLTLGSTLAPEIEDIKVRSQVELEYLGQHDAQEQVQKEIDARMAFAMPTGSTYEDHFKWIDVSGASGWWTGLIKGIWVDGAKVLKNQPFVLDISCPFVVAPPTAFEQVYRSISGSKSLLSANILEFSHSANSSNIDEDLVQDSNTFHLFPCLNPPSMAMEIAGWNFPFAPSSHMTREDSIHGPTGGRFSLGKHVERMSTRAASDNDFVHEKANGKYVNSGFCIGVVVGSDMGERPGEKWRKAGMDNTWVLGEPFFRGMGIIFDPGDGGERKARMGFRIY